MPHLFTKKRITVAVIVILMGAIGYWIFGPRKAAEPNYVIARRGDLRQEVSVTGHVKPAESVDLAFERGGKVARVNVHVADSVKSGQILVSLENGDTSAQLLQAEASLDAAKAKLDELKKGTRPEQISLDRSALQNAKDQAVADLQNDYDAALTAMNSAASVSKNALLVLTDIQFSHYGGTDQDSNSIIDAKAAAVLELLGVANAGRSASSMISSFSGGAFGLVQTAAANPTHENIDNALDKLLLAMQKVRDALYVVPVTNDFTATEKTNLNTEKTNINTQITTVSGKQQAIAVQKAANDSAIAAAEQTLNLALAGSAPEQIAAQEANVKSAEANVQNYAALLAKTIIKSPINGIVTKQEAKIGEITTAGTVVVSVISEKQFEIEAFVSEADIAKVSVGNTASITLDAYGNDVVFRAAVIKIDPSETVLEGVSTYKTTFQFAEEDTRIKSGMTANIDILTATVKDVIAVPQRVVYAKNGDKYVQILDGKNIREVKVKTGLRGNDGYIEIKDGMSESDKVIIPE